MNRSRSVVFVFAFLFVAAGAHAAQSLVWTCNNWNTQEVTFDGKTLRYKIQALCTAKEHADDFGDDHFTLNRELQGVTLNVAATYRLDTNAGTEDASIGPAMETTNANFGKQQPSHTVPFPKRTRSNAFKCNVDPFTAPASKHPGCSLTLNGETAAGWPFVDSVNNNWINAVIDGVTDPPAIAAHRVDMNAALAAALKYKESHVAVPQVMSPTNGHHFYSQPVTVKALIPGDYKDDNQLCCRIEIQKQSNGQWLPPLPLIKPNLDSVAWTMPFTDFAPIGYGTYRIRVAPTKYEETDASPWSSYVTFVVLPKEVLEIPSIQMPEANHAYPDVLPIRISINHTSTTAGVQCCQLELQVKNRGSWMDALSKTDLRLTDDNNVHYDATLFKGESTRLRARFIPPPGEAQLGWSPWTEFHTGP
jgi:hypothetical protein